MATSKHFLFFLFLLLSYERHINDICDQDTNLYRYIMHVVYLPTQWLLYGNGNKYAAYSENYINHISM